MVCVYAYSIFLLVLHVVPLYEFLNRVDLMGHATRAVTQGPDGSLSPCPPGILGSMSQQRDL